MQIVQRLLALIVVPACLFYPADMLASGEYFVYIGTFTGKSSQGIYVSRLDTASGKLTPAVLAAVSVNPSFLVIHPERPLLYAVVDARDADGHQGGAVAGFSRDVQTGKLTPLNTVPSRGTGPCFVSMDRTGRNVLVANFTSGSAAVLPIQEDGRLSEASAFVQHTGSSILQPRQSGPHVHSINLSPDNRFAIVADLGLDQVFVYRFDPVAGSLTANQPPFTKIKPGSGPRHFAFHPNGKFAYVISEMGSTVTVFAYDAARGVLNPLQTLSTLPQGFTGQSIAAEVQVHPNGRFLYGSNRGHNSIAVFAIDIAKGTLTPIGYVPTQGDNPRNFGIDPTGSYLLAANRGSNNIVVFRIDPKTGGLKPTGQSLQVGSPVCVRFVKRRG